MSQASRGTARVFDAGRAARVCVPKVFAAPSHDDLPLDMGRSSRRKVAVRE